MINHDPNREIRTGIPEVILAEPKSTYELRTAITAALELNSSVLITRVQNHQVEGIEELVKLNSLSHKSDNYNRTTILSQKSIDILSSTPFKVGIFSAGTADERFVQEIEMTLYYLGIGYKSFKDIGVAGIHRHQEVLSKINKDPKFKCIIVVAGQDGALFPVISAQSDLPIIAVPTPIGYGYGGRGLTALQAALQSCSPGVVVVNIENGFGAAVFCAKMFKQLQIPKI